MFALLVYFTLSNTFLFFVSNAYNIRETVFKTYGGLSGLSFIEFPGKLKCSETEVGLAS